MSTFPKGARAPALLHASRDRLRLAFLALAVAGFGACGGGGDGAPPGGAGGGGDAPGFAVGGTLAGLQEGETLTLLNRGGDPLVLDANGGFRFAAPVQGPYEVTVGTPPHWQACTVDAGSGTATAAVQDVAVTCQRTGTVSTVATGLNSPVSAVTDAAGNLYVTEWTGLGRLVLVTPLGYTAAVATLPGSGVGLALGPDGAFYVTTAGNQLLRVDPGGTVTTFAGTGVPGGTDGPRASATFIGLYGVAFDAAGHLYVSEFEGQRIRKISPAGIVTTLAGSGLRGSADGAGTAASFNQPSAMVVDASGNVFVADSANNRIRKITPAGVVSTLAGSGAAATVDGTGTAAGFNLPFGLTMDADGYLIVTEAMGHAVRRISPAGVVHTVAGTGVAGGGDGPVASATFNTPSGAAVDRAGNLYVVEFDANRIRRIRR